MYNYITVIYQYVFSLKDDSAVPENIRNLYLETDIRVKKHRNQKGRFIK